MEKKAIGRLVANSLHHSSAHTEVQQKAAQLMNTFPAGSAAHRLFSEIATATTVRINDLLGEDGEGFPE